MCVVLPPGLELIRYGAASRPSRTASRVGCVWAFVPIATKEKNWTGRACIDSAQLWPDAVRSKRWWCCDGWYKGLVVLCLASWAFVSFLMESFLGVG